MHVFLIDDHPLYRAGLKTLITSHGAYRISEFKNATSACLAQKKLKPDVIFLDIQLPDQSGLQALTTFLITDPQCKVFILSTHNQSIYIDHARANGASGYIVKDDDSECLLTCLDNSVVGHSLNEFYVSPNCKPITLDSDQEDNVGIKKLSHRELEILYYLSQDMTSREIGNSLFLSYRTVQNHRAKIKSKLEFTRNSELLKFSLKNQELLATLFNPDYALDTDYE